MKTLVVGASGATGRRLVEQLLDMGQHVRVIVRSPEKLPAHWLKNRSISVIQAAVLDLSEEEMAGHVKDCQAVASCLGHNLSWKGIYGKPRKLVKDSVRLLCESIKRNSPDAPIRFVLMNTAGNRNRDLNEPISTGERMVIALLRLLLPPHPDNEQAADYLRTMIGLNNPSIEWVVVRPDSLTDEDTKSEYEVFPSPTRSALFNPGKTSRVNVGHFMAKLITDSVLWNEWKGKMPVIYNTDSRKR